MNTRTKKTIATVMVIAPLAAVSIALTDLWWTLAGFGLIALWELAKYVRASFQRAHQTIADTRRELGTSEPSNDTGETR